MPEKSTVRYTVFTKNHLGQHSRKMFRSELIFTGPLQRYWPLIASKTLQARQACILGCFTGLAEKVLALNIAMSNFKDWEEMTHFLAELLCKHDGHKQMDRQIDG